MVLTVAEVQKSSHSLWSHGEHEAGLRKAIVSIAFHDARDHDAALSCYQGPPVEVSSRGKTWVERAPWRSEGVAQREHQGVG